MGKHGPATDTFTKWALNQTGAGQTTYRQFVRQNLPKYRARGLSNQDVSLWRAHKRACGGRVSGIADGGWCWHPLYKKLQCGEPKQGAS